MNGSYYVLLSKWKKETKTRTEALPLYIQLLPHLCRQAQHTAQKMTTVLSKKAKIRNLFHQFYYVTKGV